MMREANKVDSITAFAISGTHKTKEQKVFDWDKAALLIRESGTKNASAGLREDYDWTGGEIYRDGQPVLDDYTYLASTWATPTLYLDEYQTDCYVMQSATIWTDSTKWPASALAILQVAEGGRVVLMGDACPSAIDA